ncbi:MAG: hypothetical protein U0670_23685 [Anaerolineae bacterium]
MDGIVTGHFALDWAILSVSLFNTIIQLWLGITLLLTADRRHRGVWLLGGGALAGAAFFISHTAILAQQSMLNPDGLDFWWQIGWIPVMIAPFAWYVLMLWYGGYWTAPSSRLRQRHRLPFSVMAVLIAVSVMLLIILKPIPTYNEIIRADLSHALRIGGIPLLAAFPILMAFCILLALDALRGAAHTIRQSSDPARQQSLPWLLGASAVLLIVSLCVLLFVGVVSLERQRSLDSFTVGLVGVFDLVLSLLIAAAVLMMGQALISYEVVTGRTLPRHSLLQQWRTLIVLAAGYGAVVGWLLTAQFRPVYSLLLTTALMVLFYALYTWQASVERARFVARLRPFVSTQNLIGHFLTRDGHTNPRAKELFDAICREVLNTSSAQILPLGALKALVGTGLRYPADQPILMVPLPPLGTDILSIDPVQHGGFAWATPLWSERGLIGVLLTGGKRSGVYTQEEIAVAQAGGERILDMLAGETMAHSLIELQQRRIAQTRMIDLQTRRTLHDDILPLIHAAILELSGATPENLSSETLTGLSVVHRRIADLIRDLPAAPPKNTSSTDVVDVIEGIRRLLDGEFGKAFTVIHWQGSGVLMAEPLVDEVVLGAVREIIRNAAVHGRGLDKARPLTLSVCIEQDADYARIQIRDDGIGLNGESRSGSGSGLTLHRTLLALVGGTLTVENAPVSGVTAMIDLPARLFQRG